MDKTGVECELAARNFSADLAWRCVTGRQAGMAEIAAKVLHRVGNARNVEGGAA